jgi:hypothetical protein
MAIVTATSNVLDPKTGLNSYFIITYDNVSFNVESVRVINNTSKTAILRLYPPGQSMQSYTFPPGTDVTQNLPPNGKYNLDTWGYSYGFL